MFKLGKLAGEMLVRAAGNALARPVRFAGTDCLGNELYKRTEGCGSVVEMIPHHHSVKSPIRSLPKLLAAYNSKGGSIVEYQRVVSCIFVSQKSSHYVWVPPHGNRALRSWPDTITTLLLGWWSLFGLFWTIQVLIGNLTGGRDATDELLAATGGGNVALAQRTIDEEVSARRKQSMMALVYFVAIVGGIALVFWLIGEICDWSMRKSAAKQQATQVRARQAHTATPVVRVSTDSTAMVRPDKPTAANTNAARMIRPEPAPRLQAIFYDGNGRNSTAIINRKTVSVGEDAGGYTVLAIERDSVTLKTADGEKVTLHLAGAGAR